MKKENLAIKFMFPIFLVITMLLDAQVSNLLRRVTESHMFILSHFLLIVLILGSIFYSKRYMVVLSVVLGLLFDSYYYSILGINTVSIPLTVVLIYWVFDYIEPTLPSLLLSLVVFITIMDVSGYLIQVVFNLIKGDFIGFVTKQLGPTYFANIVAFLILSYPINKLLKKQKRP